MTPVVKATAPVAAASQAQSDGYYDVLKRGGAFGSGIAPVNMGGVSYLGAVTGTTSYAANTLTVTST